MSVGLRISAWCLTFALVGCEEPQANVQDRDVPSDLDGENEREEDPECSLATPAVAGDCTTLCWRQQTGLTADSDCNTPGDTECDLDFTCENSESPACLPDSTGLDYRLDIDLPRIRASDNAPEFSVTLVLRVNGSPWPQSQVGSLTGFLQTTVDGLQRVDLPSDSDRITLTVTQGTFFATFDYSPDRQGQTSLRSSGLFEIKDDGVLEIDLPTAVVDIELTQNGQAFPETSSAVRLERSDPSSGHVFAMVSNSANGPLLVPPGTYDATVRSPFGPTPAGSLTACANDTTRFRYDVETKPVSGTVVVDGDAVPDTLAGLTFVHHELGGSVSVPTIEGSFEVDLPDGTYEVWLDSSGPVNSARTLPFGTTQLARDYTPALSPLERQATSVAVQGRVTLNGSDAAQTAAAFIDFLAPSAFGRLALHEGQFEGEVYSATYQAVLRGEAPYPVRQILAESWIATTGAQEWHSQAVTVAPSFTFNGAPTPSDDDAYLANIKSDSIQVSVSVASPTKVSLAPGTYVVEYGNDPFDSGAGFDERFPFGSAQLGTVRVLDTDQTSTFDVSAVTVGGNVTLNGAPLAETPDRENRGLVRVGVGLGYVPPTGAAEYSIHLVPGQRAAVVYSCGPPECDVFDGTHQVGTVHPPTSDSSQDKDSQRPPNE